MDDHLDPVEALRRLGWSASRAELIGLSDRKTVDTAIREGRIVRIAHGRYGLPDTLGPAQQAATRVNGVVSHLSAATRLGLAVRQPPTLPTITVPHARRLSAQRRAGVILYTANLRPEEIRDGVTTPLRTVLDCASRLPFAEALVVADSALHRNLVTPEQLRTAARSAPPQFRTAVTLVASQADGRSQSAFESLIRGYAIGVRGLGLEPQVPVAGFTPDLYDMRLRLAVECDSFEHHAKRKDLVRDCERYNMFTVAGIALVRFAWEHSMHQPGYVRSTLASAVVAREHDLRLPSQPNA